MLTELLLSGHAPANPFDGHDIDFVHLEFSLPHLFERLVYVLLRGAPGGPLRGPPGPHRPPGRWSRAGVSRHQAGPWSSHAVRRPCTCSDAKYKPAYGRGGKVSRDDVFQLFFYQSWLAQLDGGLPCPRALFVAPTFGEALEGREIAMAPSGRSVQLAFIDVPSALSALGQGVGAAVVLRRHAASLWSALAHQS